MKEKQVAVAYLMVEGEALEAAVKQNGRAKKRLEIIDALRDGPKPVPLLNSMAPGAVNKLAEQGVVQTVGHNINFHDWRECIVDYCKLGRGEDLNLFFCFAAYHQRGDGGKSDE